MTNIILINLIALDIIVINEIKYLLYENKIYIIIEFLDEEIIIL